MRDYFERLGLPRRFSVDPAEVERRYLALSREAHPDFHHLGTDSDQRMSLEATAALNEAYLTLRDPFRRGEYLLGLLGGPTAQVEKNLDQAFLAEMMDLRERIEELKETRVGIDELEANLSLRLHGIADQITDLFATAESNPDDSANHRAALASIRRLLNAAKTLNSLLREVRDER